MVLLSAASAPAADSAASSLRDATLEALKSPDATVRTKALFDLVEAVDCEAKAHSAFEGSSQSARLVVEPVPIP